MLRVQAYRIGNTSLSSRFLDSLDIVAPVSSEMKLCLLP